MSLQGVYLPIITPFLNGEIDFGSYNNLINYYIDHNISGIMPAGTTGEAPVLSDFELEELLDKTASYVNDRVPVYFGVGGNNTIKTVSNIKKVEKYKIDGILSVCPYYNRPDQEGIYQHFKALSESTSLKIILYNIPYRTGINMENDTILRLAELDNIIGIKDSCGNINQTIDLIKNKLEGFSIVTGDDSMFYINCVHGGDGGILASSHINTLKYIEIFNLVRENNHSGALKKWYEIKTIIPFLFNKPNPAPLKYILKKKGLIESDEIRLPLINIDHDYEQILDNFL